MGEHAGTGSGRFDPKAVRRRTAERRTRLGLSEGALATRVGMSPRYLQQVLGAGPGFDQGGFVRIATALGLTYRELLEGREDMPPGRTGPGPRPVLTHLSEEECWDRLGTHGVGRIALPVHPGPAVLPVNYAVESGTILYRTAPDGSAAAATGAAVSFQVDRLDDRLGQGWSVLVTGTAERIEDAATIRELTDRHLTRPWAGGKRPLWIRIQPQTLSGRRITTM